jgi:uncharacterized membrane protein
MATGERTLMQVERARARGEFEFSEERPRQAVRLPRRDEQSSVNVGSIERIVSGAAGGILLLQGLARRDLVGLGIASIGGALLYRGTTGHCSAYQALGVNTAQEDGRRKRQAEHATRVTHSFLIDKSPEELYAYWRNFENLPNIMSHLKSVQVMDQRRSHWVATAPRVYGGEVQWDAEITADDPNSRIAWQSLPGGDLEHRGSVQFGRALGERGTMVRVILEYEPPAGQVGRWTAKLFGEAPEQQIREDLRRFKRIMEIGEAPTTEGQSHGTCRRSE